MPASMATVSDITKEIYEGPVREQLNNEVVGLKRLERSSANITENVGGKYVDFPIHYGRNSGIGARKENEALPDAGHQATASAHVSLKYLYGSAELSGPVLALADTNTQAFISGLDLEINGVKDDLQFDLNRQVYGDGVGNFATLSSVTTSGATVDSGMDYIGINQVVDLWKSSNLALGNATKTGVEITGVVDNGDGTGSITFSTSGTVTAVNTLTITGNANREWIGYDSIISDSGTLYNVDPSNVPQWKATVDDNGGVNRALSESLIIQNVDKVRKMGGKTSLLLTSLGVRRSYFNLLSQQRQFVGTKEFEGGFKGLAFTTDAGEIPLVADAFGPYNTLWGISEKNLKVHRKADWKFMDRDGSMWNRVSGKDAYEATLYQYSEIGTDRRGVHFKIEDVKEG